MKRIVLSLLKIFKRFVSPILEHTLGHACRFTPTCSEYAYDAVEKYGVTKGGLMAGKRILRCHPFAKSGYDPVK